MVSVRIQGLLLPTILCRRVAKSMKDGFPDPEIDGHEGTHCRTGAAWAKSDETDQSHAAPICFVLSCFRGSASVLGELTCEAA
jgi:hypothetical protein